MAKIFDESPYWTHFSHANGEPHLLTQAVKKTNVIFSDYYLVTAVTGGRDNREGRKGENGSDDYNITYKYWVRPFTGSGDLSSLIRYTKYREYAQEVVYLTATLLKEGILKVSDVSDTKQHIENLKNKAVENAKWLIEEHKLKGYVKSALSVLNIVFHLNYSVFPNKTHVNLLKVYFPNLFETDLKYPPLTDDITSTKKTFNYYHKCDIYSVDDIKSKLQTNNKQPRKFNIVWNEMTNQKQRG